MGLLPEISLDLANRFYTFGWRTSVIGAGITLIGIFFLYWGTRVRDHDFELQISRAHERAAQLEKEAAVARLEQEQLKVKLAWRRLTSEQHDKIVAMLRGHPMTIALRYSNEPESMLLAVDVIKTLKDSGIEVVATMDIGAELIFGLRIADMKPPHSADWTLLVSAFSSANVAFSLAEPVEGLKITIGSKPPSF